MKIIVLYSFLVAFVAFVMLFRKPFLGMKRKTKVAPAYAYDKTLPQMGFEEIPSKEYVPVKGDISVLPQNEESSFGHIAIYDGKRWVSDFKQKCLYPNSFYRKKGNEKLFRASDGWHWKHVWTSPIGWYDWMISLVKGFNKIKF